MASNHTNPCSRVLAGDEITGWINSFTALHTDIGTGDGAFALRIASEHPELAVLGIDTCLDNLTKAAIRGRPNLRFVASDARESPPWLRGMATSVSINFPYRSLFHAVAGTESGMLEGILAVAHPGATIEIRVNASAGAEYGVTPEVIRERVGQVMRRVAPQTSTVRVVPQDEMRSFPSTWAKRLAYGRPSLVIVASARLGV
jgi:hypothetical protein